MRKSLLLAWVLALPLSAGCGGDPETSEAPQPPTLAELKSASYHGLDGEERSVTLTRGVWEGEPFVEGGASRPTVHFVRDFVLRGDLDQDGVDEAVVLLSESSGGSGEFLYVAVAVRSDGEVKNIATAPIGDRVQIRAGWTEGARIYLDVVQAGPQDAACCPGELVTRGWELLSQGGLEEVPGVKSPGRLSLDAIGEIEWVLREWSWGEKAAAEPEISLMYKDGQLSGRAGCNRYFGSIEDTGSPGEITIGPLGSTQMACADDVMAVERRFLEQLGGTKQYGFMAGQLSLSYVKNGDWGVMLFDAREPDLETE